METRRRNALYGKCRCCNTEGHHRDLMKEYNENGRREIYYNMIMECFNLFLSTKDDLNKLICITCILRLRDAFAFRSLVSATERQLLGSMVDKDTVFVNVPVQQNDIMVPELDIKPEVVNMKQEPVDVTDDEQHTDGDDIEDSEMPLQNADDSDTSEAIKDKDSFLVEGETDFVARFYTPDFRLPTRTTLYANSLSGFVKQLDLLKGELIFPKMLEKMLEESENETLDGSKKVYTTEKSIHIHNISTILLHSNATPFKSKNRLGFPCYYCGRMFENFDKLKDHQAEQHNKTELRKILASHGVESIAVNVDVTDLKCTICNQSVPKLNDLKSHLIKQHNKMFHAGFTDRVVPYKLSPDNIYTCQVCGFNFETFGSIERHMNVHFRNYVCKECGTGFVTKYRLKVHTKSMHVEGSFPCEVCKKVFTTQQKHKNHVDTVHKMVKRFKCPKCTERFSEYFKRQKHLVQVHGVAPLQYKCNVCEKSFDRRYTLSRHMKRDHLEERDFQCELCTYKCFTNNELRVHMIKHNGERVHECSVCKKSYARKKTLREHMRIHNNDRRFGCAVCGQAFVQKCSLKGHIKTHHLGYSLQ